MLQCPDWPKFHHEHAGEQGVSQLCVFMFLDGTLKDEAADMDRYQHSIVRFAASLKKAHLEMEFRYRYRYIYVPNKSLWRSTFTVSLRAAVQAILDKSLAYFILFY